MYEDKTYVNRDHSFYPMSGSQVGALWRATDVVLKSSKSLQNTLLQRQIPQHVIINRGGDAMRHRLFLLVLQSGFARFWTH